MKLELKHFGLIIDLLDWVDGISLSLNPIWFHKHGGGWHYHLLIELLFFYIELRIGKDEAEQYYD